MSGRRLPHLSFPEVEPGGPACRWPREKLALTLPLSDQYPILIGQWPMAEDEWDQMMRILNVMKPALTGQGST